MTPDIALRRLALTGQNALQDLCVEKHPVLRRTLALAAADAYDDALVRVDQVLRRAARPEYARAEDYALLLGDAGESLRAQVLTLGRCARLLERLPSWDVSELPEYLWQATAEVHQALDQLEEEIVARRAPEQRLSSEQQTSLKQLVEEILDAVSRTRKTFTFEHRIPEQFRSSLRHDAAIQQVQRLIPPFSGQQKRDFRRVLWEQALDDDVTVNARDYTVAYNKAMANYEHRLRDGYLPGGGSATVRLGKDVVPNKSYTIAREFVLGSGENNRVRWTVTLQLVPRTAFTLVFRFSLKSRGLQSVMKKWLRSAMSVMRDTADNPEAEKDYQREQIREALHAAQARLDRAFARGHVAAQVSQGDDGGTLLEVEMTRTQELHLPTDETKRAKQMMQMHGINRALFGTRSAAEQKARALVERLGWVLVAAQEVRERSTDLHTFGFKFFFTLPENVRPGMVVKTLDQLAWAIGKGRQPIDQDAQQQMQQFEQEFGVARTNKQSAQVQRSVLRRKLALRIDKMLRDENLLLSNYMRTQLERMKVDWLESRDVAFKDLNALVFDIPNELDRVEETFRHASVARPDTTKLRGFLLRTMPNLRNARARLVYAGLEDRRVPCREDIIDMVVAMAENDVERYGRSSDTYRLHIINGTPMTTQQVVAVASADVSLSFESTGRTLEIVTEISAAAQRRVA